MARGASAKTQLCWYWLTEFIIREHLNGSTGKVGPPIISRIIQFLSDGMIFYNHARKIMFIPFPFPHAQIAVIFVIISIPAVAFLMDQYADSIMLGSFLTFISVACLSGIHEVARELENPFRNVPNEIPVVTFQAQFNEALIVMYSGYHPDHFWDPTKHNSHPAEPTPRQTRKYGSKINRTTSFPAAGTFGRASNVTASTSTGPRRVSSAGKAAEDIPKPDGLPRTSSAPARNTEVSDPASPISSPPVSPKRSSETERATPIPIRPPPGRTGGEKEEVEKMKAKMDEYGKEIERLKSLLEKAGENKSD